MVELLDKCHPITKLLCLKFLNVELLDLLLDVELLDFGFVHLLTSD